MVQLGGVMECAWGLPEVLRGRPSSPIKDSVEETLIRHLLPPVGLSVLGKGKKRQRTWAGERVALHLSAISFSPDSFLRGTHEIMKNCNTNRPLKPQGLIQSKADSRKHIRSPQSPSSYNVYVVLMSPVP